MQKILALLLLAAACAGCAWQPVIVPEDVGARGLLVGELCSTDNSFPRDGDPVITSKTLLGSPKTYVGGLRDGYLTVPLSPGEYQISSITQHDGGMQRFFPVWLDFKIERQQATSIGMILVNPSHRPESGPGAATAVNGTPFAVIPLDHADAMAKRLQDTHPQLYASLRTDNPVLLPYKLADAAKLTQYRMSIAKTRLESDLRRGVPAEYVTGCAGTVARLGSSGRSGLTLLPTDTLVDLSYCSPAGDRLACLISRREYLSVIGGKVTHETLPEGITANSMQAASSKRLVLVDDSMNVYTRADGDKEWTRYSDVAFASPLTLDGRGDPKHRFTIHMGANSFYVFGRALDAAHTRLLQGDYQTGALRKVELPPKMSYLSTFRETRKGLFIGPSWTFFAKGSFHFLPNGASVWEQRRAPMSECWDIAFPDESGDQIQLRCRQDEVWNSADGGVTWQRIFRANSLFASP